MKGINLAEWAIRHKQIVYFFIISILIGGIFSYFKLGRSEDPNFTIREMVVAAAWPGATAEQITNQVTYPLERKLQDTKGLDYIKSFTHPKGNNINKTGIKPDIEVSLDTSLLNKNKDEITHDEDNQLQEAIKAVEKEK